MSEFTLSAALDWIQGGGHAGHKAGLDHMYALLDALGNPERGLRFVHVAGTNGKGSTCAVLERALRQAGMKTGLYTSPDLCRYNERIRVNGAPIPDGPLLSYIFQLRDTAEKLIGKGIYPTPFEMGTALAYGFTACPYCIGGETKPANSTTGDPESTVFFDLDGTTETYHKNPTCPDVPMSNPIDVTLQYVLDWGFEPCPYCNPPASIG